MNRRLALAVAAAVLLAACGHSPTAAPTRSPTLRHDGGNTLGSGNFTGGSGSPTSGSGTDATTSDGGNTLGAAPVSDGGNTLGSGN